MAIFKAPNGKTYQNDKQRDLIIGETFVNSYKGYYETVKSEEETKWIVDWFNIANNNPYMTGHVNKDEERDTSNYLYLEIKKPTVLITED